MSDKKSDPDILVVDAVGPNGEALGHRFKEGAEEGEPVLCVPLPDDGPDLPGLEAHHVRHLTGNMYELCKRPTSDGPAQVANESYRVNYDATFGVKPKGKQYLN